MTTSDDSDESDDDNDNQLSNRPKQCRNSNGFNDFCVRNVHLARYGREAIQIAEKGNSIFWFIW